VNGGLALTVRFVNAGSCLNQPDEALGVAPESSDVRWGLCVARSGDVQRGSSSHQLDEALQTAPPTCPQILLGPFPLSRHRAELVEKLQVPMILFHRTELGGRTGGHTPM